MDFIILLFIFLFGLVIGSFLNCVIWRLHTGDKLTGRSFCPHCQRLIAWYDNIPVLSFLVLRGKCRKCNQPIAIQYPLVELATGILFVVAAADNFRLPISDFQSIQGFLAANQFTLIKLFRDLFLISAMVVIFVFDLRWYLILDVVTIPAALLVLILNILLGYSWQNLLISAIIGMGFFMVQFIISKGRWIGGGDIRLGLLMGAALGWPDILVALFLAYTLGSIVGIGLILKHKKGWNSQVPLGAFLAPATLIALFFGREILGWYLGLMHF